MVGRDDIEYRQLRVTGKIKPNSTYYLCKHKSDPFFFISIGTIRSLLMLT